MIQAIGLTIGITIGAYFIYMILTSPRFFENKMVIVQFADDKFAIQVNGNKYLDLALLRHGGLYYWSRNSTYIKDCKTSSLEVINESLGKYLSMREEPKVYKIIK